MVRRHQFSLRSIFWLTAWVAVLCLVGPPLVVPVVSLLAVAVLLLGTWAILFLGSWAVILMLFGNRFVTKAGHGDEQSSRDQ